MRHLLSIEKLSAEEIRAILASAPRYKLERGRPGSLPLAGQSWALIFSKSSTRTRVSFEVGIRELGGQVMFLNATDIQLGRGELIKDTARVLGRMIHGAVIRTFEQADVEEFAAEARVPTVNALTDHEHPCQILADLFTVQEKRGSLDGLVVTFVGDGGCNVATSWVWAAARLGFELRVAAPAAFQPHPDLLARAGGRVEWTCDPQAAVRGADVLYTDVWVSMGKEAEAPQRLAELADYRLDHALVQLAKPGALVMHCLPAYRGKEIAEDTFEAHASTIFDQAENRLHAQKAVLGWLQG
ncbi:MAG: ornithine carbamoyltransferase [Verrucomicrobia bacterium]|nr:ornithine carbamoyltransferase [Verrucomicrobiota bacterium]